MSVFPITPVGKEEAIAALRKYAWPDPEEAHFVPITLPDNHGDALYRKVITKPGRQMVHTRAGFGMDLPLEECENRIREADEVFWQVSLFSHDLHACKGDKVISFEVPSPYRERELAEDRLAEAQRQVDKLRASLLEPEGGTQ
jgi:hypothetical protein